MTDDETTLAQLRDLVRAFSKERDWEQFHGPKDLGLALASEVGEVLELFRYKPPAMIDAELRQAGHREQLGHELADCLWLILRLADVCGINLSASLEEKVALADKKYPVDVVKGLPYKYSDYAKDPSGLS